MSSESRAAAIRVRRYNHGDDYAAVDRLLVDLYRPGPNLVAWLQPRWEYMHFHSNIDNVDMSRFGVAEAAGRMLGVVHAEHADAFVYVQRHRMPGVAEALLGHAEQHMGGMSHTFGREVLGIYVNDADRVLRELVAARGFVRMEQHGEHESQLAATSLAESTPLAAGFELVSLEEDNDFSKIHRVLWRGFDHPGPPPPEGVADRERAQRAPNFRPDLTMAVRGQDGEFVSFAGMWLAAANRVGYVEPVATDPEFRRRGFAALAIRESVRRVIALGAQTIWVGSHLPVYTSLGFETTSHTALWLRDL